MCVKVFPALKDNYMYMLIETASKQCALVDPVEPKSLIEVIKKNNYNLTHILTTHHHFDHSGGNGEVVKYFQKPISIIGADNRIDTLNCYVSDNESFNIGKLLVKCIYTPCHTSGHVSFFVISNESEAPVLFSGDTLFVGGCGRFFEGTGSDMLKSLNKLKKLPLETRVFCGHEYTVNNLKFAHYVESANLEVKEKLKWAEAEVGNGRPTIPSTIRSEMETNPFMRTHIDHYQNLFKTNDEEKIMSLLRSGKDKF